MIPLSDISIVSDSLVYMITDLSAFLLMVNIRYQSSQNVSFSSSSLFIVTFMPTS
jgi:hypothetical protein